MKVEATEARLSPTIRPSGGDCRGLSEAKDGCSGASSHGDPLTDGRGIERVQRWRLRFIEVSVGLLAQQAPAHE
jgi:hypothetical protein